MNESEHTRKKIKPVITERGGVCVKKAAGPHSPIGMPDLLGCYRGRALALEVKMPGQSYGITDKQQYTLDLWKLAGAEVGVVRLPEDVEKILDRIDSEANYAAAHHHPYEGPTLNG